MNQLNQVAVSGDFRQGLMLGWMAVHDSKHVIGTEASPECKLGLQVLAGFYGTNGNDKELQAETLLRIAEGHDSLCIRSMLGSAYGAKGQELLARATADDDAIRGEREEKAKAALKAEQARLDAEQARVKAEQKAEQARLDAEHARVEAERQADKKVKRAELAKNEAAAERARLDAARQEYDRLQASPAGRAQLKIVVAKRRSSGRCERCGEPTIKVTGLARFWKRQLCPECQVDSSKP